MLSIILSFSSLFILNPHVINEPLDSVHHLSGVVIEEERQRTAAPTSANVQIVDKERLEAMHTPQVMSSLSGRIPSLFITERNILGFGISTGGSGGIKIRGVGGANNETLVLVNGQPQYSGLYSHQFADPYTLSNLEQVEVYSGPASMQFGSGAMGGAINLITRNALGDGLHGEAGMRMGSYGTVDANGMLSWQKGALELSTAASLDRTDGVRKNFDFRQGSGYAKAAYRFSTHWKGSIDYSLVQFIGNDPTYMSQTITSPYTQNILRGAASARIENSYEKGTGTLQLFYNYGNHFISDPRPFHSTDEHWGALLFQKFALSATTMAHAGLDLSVSGGAIPLSGGTAYAAGSISTMRRKSMTEVAPYLWLSQSLWGDRLSLDAGTRYTWSDRFGSSWIPQGGLTWQIAKGTTLKGSVGKGYRNPSFRELYLYKSANAQLDPEEMMNYELSLRQSLWNNRLSIGVTAYYAHGKNLIETVAHPELGHPLNENSGAFTNKGIEATLALHPIESLSVESSYSYLHTNIDNLTGAPTHQFFAGIGWRATERWNLYTEVRTVSGLFVAADTPMQHYTLWNSRISYRPLPALELYAAAQNMLGKSYYINYGYRMPGCTMFGGLKVTF